MLVEDVHRYNAMHVLPGAGGWSDQHPWFTSAVSEVERALASVEGPIKALTRDRREVGHGT